MNRRGFFATLLAPVLAKCLPKTKPAGEVIFHLPHSIGYKFGWTGFNSSPPTYRFVFGKMADAQRRMSELLAADLYDNGFNKFSGGRGISSPFIYEEDDDADF